MTTDIVIRYAEDINRENEIANFQRYAISGDSIAAVSWELPGVPRRTGGGELLKKMTEKLLLGSKSGLLHVIVELSAVQPDNSIVNYKKTWGLLKARGVNVDNISDKVSFIKKTEGGLILSGFGIVDYLSTEVINDLFNCNEKIYFAFLDSRVRSDEFSLKGNLTDWMSKVWGKDGVIFLLMGYFDEVDCEIVALAHKNALSDLLGSNDMVV